MEHKAWNDLQDYYNQFINTFSLSDEFKKDENRFNKFHVKLQLGDDFVLLDYSKNMIDEQMKALLIKVALAADLHTFQKKMCSGELINFTEKRAVLHVALRNIEHTPYLINGQNITPDVDLALQKMQSFVERVHKGDVKGYSGKKFTHLVNIGIGGSDLGPVMVTEALKPYSSTGLKPYFVSNIDGTHMAEVLKIVDPETTLFIISSKTFTTIETLTNAITAKNWFLEKVKDPKAIASNFIAVSTNSTKVQEFGIDVKNMFIFWDWVGGRYSLWSSIGISIALTIGFDNFKKLLTGAHLMDKHFFNAPIEVNIPVLLALVGILNNNLEKRSTHAIFPYDQYLHRFPAYVQQADMESNGKSTNRQGRRILSYDTGPIIWGEPGTNGQHAFYQLLHQGTRRVACDFICPVKSHNPLRDNIHHNILYANFVAQTEALMVGKPAETVEKELKSQNFSQTEIEANVPHRIFDGERPSNSIVFSEINPTTLGAMIAMYEHKIFVQGIVWGINSFDQFGVELGKQLSNKILENINQRRIIHHHDSSTNGLLNTYFDSL